MSGTADSRTRMRMSGGDLLPHGGDQQMNARPQETPSASARGNWRQKPQQFIPMTVIWIRWITAFLKAASITSQMRPRRTWLVS